MIEHVLGQHPFTFATHLTREASVASGSVGAVRTSSRRQRHHQLCRTLGHGDVGCVCPFLSRVEPHLRID